MTSNDCGGVPISTCSWVSGRDYKGERRWQKEGQGLRAKVTGGETRQGQEVRTTTTVDLYREVLWCAIAALGLEHRHGVRTL